MANVIADYIKRVTQLSQILKKTEGIGIGEFEGEIYVNLTGTPELLASGGGIGPAETSVLQPLYTTGVLTLESGNAYPITDQIGKSTLYYTSTLNDGVLTTNPFEINISDGAALQRYTSNQISITPTLVAGTAYDVFIYNTGGALALDVAPTWASLSARSAERVPSMGQLVKAGATNRRWIGSLEASGTNLMEDSIGGYVSQVGGKRYLYNGYNKIIKPAAVTEQTGSWAYTLSTVRQANGAAGNRVDFFNGDAAIRVSARVVALAYLMSNLSAGGFVGVGLDNITAIATPMNGLLAVRSGAYNTDAVSSIQLPVESTVIYSPGLGHHYAAWLESGADNNCTYIGSGVSGLILLLPM